MVDSSVWIDYFNGVDNIATNQLDQLLGTELIGVGDLMLVEVLQGFRQHHDYITAKEILTSLTVVHLLGQKIAIQSADNFRFLRTKGVTVRKTIDVIIATFCIEHNFALLHNDRDFEPFQRYLGLRSIAQ